MTREFIRMTGSLRGRAKRSRPSRQVKNAARSGFRHVENVFGRQHSHRPLQPAASGIHRPPLIFLTYLPFSLTPPIIKLAAAVSFWTYYSHHIAYSACPGQAESTSAQKYLIMQNKPNFPRFCVKNSYLEEKQTQFKPNQTQFFTSFFLPMLPINPNQTQSQTTPACPVQSTGEAGAQQFQNFARPHLGNPGLINVGFCEQVKTTLAFGVFFGIRTFNSDAHCK